MPLEMILKPYTLDHPTLTQKFETGNLIVSFEATYALGEGCSNALWAMLAAHVSNSMLGSMSKELHHLNTRAIEGNGKQVVTMGRFGDGTKMLVVVTDNLHSDEPTTRIDVVGLREV